jgi:putative phosphoesterase
MATIEHASTVLVVVMRVAFLSDIHSNLPALSAVLDDLPQVETVVCLGDVVGYYADPNEVCDLLRKYQIPSIRGNHEAYVLGELVPHHERTSAYRTEWTKKVLERRNVEWLRSLGRSMRFHWGNFDVQLHHATPWDEEGYLYPDSDLSRIQLEKNQCLALGHTHHPMMRKGGSGLVLNPGSVGQPRDCNPMAAYAILDCISGEVEFRRVRYDVASLQNRLRHLGWDPAVIDILSRTSRDSASK